MPWPPRWGGCRRLESWVRTTIRAPRRRPNRVPPPPGAPPSPPPPCVTPISRRCRGSPWPPSTGRPTGPPGPAPTEATEPTAPTTRPRRWWAGPARPRSPGDRTPRCTGRSCGPCGCSPVSGRPRTRTSASGSSCARAAVGCRWPSIFPPSWDATPMTPTVRARSVAAGWRWTPWPTWRTCSPVSTWVPSPRR